MITILTSLTINIPFTRIPINMKVDTSMANICFTLQFEKLQTNAQTFSGTKPFFESSYINSSRSRGPRMLSHSVKLTVNFCFDTMFILSLFITFARLKFDHVYVWLKVKNKKKHMTIFNYNF